VDELPQLGRREDPDFGRIIGKQLLCFRFPENGRELAAQLAEDIKDAPCIMFALAVPPGGAGSVVPATQNLMLAARALGIGSIPTTLHPTVMERFNELFGIPKGTQFHFCIPLGYPKGHFGPTSRKPTTETTFLNTWASPVPWATEEPVSIPNS